MLPKFRKEAQEELIEERLKLQEAKRVGIEISDEEVKRVMKGIAERNKMTEEQFTQQIKGNSGVDVATMRERMKAQFAWREVVRRRGQMLISINERDVERMLSSSANEAGRGHGRAAGAKDHAVDARADGSDRHGQALCRSRCPAA